MIVGTVLSRARSFELARRMDEETFIPERALWEQFAGRRRVDEFALVSLPTLGPIFTPFFGFYRRRRHDGW